MKAKKKTDRKRKDIGVKDYCEACLIIRTGSYNSSGASRRKRTPHTCNKTIQELNEFIYHMGMINLMRGKEVFE